MYYYPSPLNHFLHQQKRKKVAGIAVDKTWIVVASNIVGSAVSDVVGVTAGDLVSLVDAEGIAYCFRG